MSPPSGTVNPSLSVADDGVAWITLDDPERKLNVLTEEVLRGLEALLDDVSERATAGSVRAVVIRSGKPDSFIAGADVGAIAAIESPDDGRDAARTGQAIFQKVAELPVPTIAAIHGICLGGGLEMSLACGHRVASDADATKMGLPEVQLGILPAWGGTTRLPRLIGLQAALDLLLTGKTIDGRRALRRGLVSAVVPAELFSDAVADFAAARAAGEPLDLKDGRSLVTRVLDDTSLGRRIVLGQARKRVLAQTGGHYPAPLAILDVIRDAGRRSVPESLEREATAAGELLVSTVSKNLIHVFNLREGVKKRPGLPDSGDPVEAIGILGAGVMGGGIAQLAAFNGIRVRVKDIRHDAVSGALAHARSLFDKAVARRTLTRLQAGQRMELIAGALDYAGFGTADLVVEAVVERMDVKRAVLAEVERLVPESAVLCSNTSSLSIDEMAEALERPDRFGGMHFFNPVHRMPLVEVVRGGRTSEDTVARIYDLALRLRKIPVIVRDGAGFLVNRILGPYLNEAGFILGDGASIEAVDRAAKAFGMPMGPLRLIDEIGIDVAGHAGGTLHEAFGARMEPALVLTALGATERLGRKGGLGFYRYQGDKEAGVDEPVYGALGDAVPSARVGMDAAEITERLVLAMVNEAARALEDGIVARAADVDLAMIMGTGFPPFRGGLLQYADSLHPRSVLARIQALRERHGVRFEPAPALERLAAEDRLFYQAFPS